LSLIIFLFLYLFGVGLSYKNVLIVVISVIVALLVLGILLSLFIVPSDRAFTGLFGNVALIEIKGEILSTSAFNATNAFDVVDAIDRADKDVTVSAILLEINSPGGSVVATRQIVEKIRETKKPVVAWISDIGTSGAYYVASACDLVIADEHSITGSIGAVSIVWNFSEMLEKLGIKVDVLKEGKYKGMASIFTELTPEERKIIEGMLKQVYEGFKGDILKFRGGKINKTRFEQVADGRLLTGKQALDYGLIDELGSREYAIKRAGELAGLKKPNIKRYTTEPTLQNLLFNAGYSFGQGMKSALSNQFFTIR